MKIFNWIIKSRAGKMALSAMQAVGLSAAVGVAGIAAWQFLGAPADNTAFSPQSYDPGEVVYVAGAAGGSYDANGEVKSAFQAKSSKAIEMTERLSAAQKRADEYDDSVTLPAGTAEPAMAAYQMGSSEGLGMGSNAAREENNPMAMVQRSMAGVTDALSRVQSQSQGAAAQAGQKPEGAVPTLASASKDWGSSAAKQSLSGGNGSAFNSTFAIQGQAGGAADGKGQAAAMAQAGDVIAQAQQQAMGMTEGMRMRGQTSFGKEDGLGGSRNAVIADQRRSKAAGDLEFIRKRSADAALNKHRSTNEGARAFLASTKISGGVSVTGDSVVLGEGQGSKDFDSDYNVNTGRIRSAMDAVASREADRHKDRLSMQRWFWAALGVAVSAMIAIPFLKNITIFGVNLGLVMACLAIGVLSIGFVKAAHYAGTWGKSGLSTTFMITLGILIGGVWASFHFADAFKTFYQKVAKIFGIGGKGGATAGGGATGGAGAAGGGAAGGGAAGGAGAAGGGAAAGAGTAGATTAASTATAATTTTAATATTAGATTAAMSAGTAALWMLGSVGAGALLGGML